MKNIDLLFPQHPRHHPRIQHPLHARRLSDRRNPPRVYDHELVRPSKATVPLLQRLPHSSRIKPNPPIPRRRPLRRPHIDPNPHFTCLYTFNVSSAVFRQSKCFALLSPASLKRAATSRLWRIPPIASASAFTLVGSTLSPASPAVSSHAVPRLTITGHPHAIASRIGKPNPS